jgi:hypothetical protein
MALYRNAVTGAYPVTEQTIRAANPTVSLPVEIDATTAQAFGFDLVAAAPQPGPNYQEGPPVQTGDGSWSQTWVAVAQPLPPPVTRMSPLEWMSRLSSDESTAIATAAQSNASILFWMLQAAAAQFIDVTDQRTIEGVNALAQAGLIQSGRVAELLAPAA